MKPTALASLVAGPRWPWTPSDALFILKPLQHLRFLGHVEDVDWYEVVTSEKHYRQQHYCQVSAYPQKLQRPNPAVPSLYYCYVEHGPKLPEDFSHAKPRKPR